MAHQASLFRSRPSKARSRRLIHMRNEDVIDLYQRVKVGTRVVVI